MFRNNNIKPSSELEFIEQKIQETQTDSPCEAAMLTLMRAAAKTDWIPKDLKACDNIYEEFINIKDIRTDFPRLYSRFNLCFNTMAINKALHDFKNPSTNQFADLVASTIEANNRSMEIIINEKNPAGKSVYKRNIEINEEVAANLRFFSKMHITCLANGSLHSMKEADKHINEITKIANRK